MSQVKDAVPCSVCADALDMMTSAVPRTADDRQLDPADDTTLEDARLELARRVYDAAIYFENLEHAGLINANGHVKAQKVVTWAAVELELCWIGPR